MSQAELVYVGLSEEDIRDIRREADDDVFFFGRVICGHKDLVYEDHAPLMYAAAGDAGKLLALLRSGRHSYTISAVKVECARQGIDIAVEDAEARLSEALRVVDIRDYRHGGKSSAITHSVRTWKIVREPNLTSAIITNTDPKAADFCKQIRATILSPFFAAVYPDRVPADPKALTENRIIVAGRSVPDMEPCLMAFGHKVGLVGYHFDEIHTDDLVARENKSVAELAMVKEFLANLPGLYKPGIRFRIRRVHVGTRWDEYLDDCSIVRAYEKAFRIDIPIWVRETYTEDILAHGVPTTSWYPLEKILVEQEEVLSNDEEGIISWRCNYELNPTIGHGTIFPPRVVDEEKWEPHFVDVGLRDFGTTKSPLKDPRTGRGVWVKREARDEKTNERVVNPETGRFKMLVFDPMKLYRVTCCDQSFSPDGGDEWAVATVGMDQYGFSYDLEVTHGRGVELMLDAAEMHRMKWSPVAVGFEKIAAQEVIELVFKFGQKYRHLRGAVTPVPHRGQPKEWRIRNYLAEYLKIHRHKLSPFDTYIANQMKKYRGTDNDKDDGLDVLAMCTVLHQMSTQPRDGEKDKNALIRQRNMNRRSERMAAYGA